MVKDKAIAMRRVYGQNWLVTLLKFAVLTTSYVFGLLAVFAVSALFAAFSV